MKTWIAYVVLGLSVGMQIAQAKCPPKATPAILEKGKKAYAMPNCALCHGDLGDGKGPAGAALVPPVRNFLTDGFKTSDTVDGIFKVATEGLPGTAMVGFPGISEEDRCAIAHYIVKEFRSKYKKKK